MSEKNKLDVSLNDKLDIILSNQKKILKNEERILGEEVKIEEFETRELNDDNLMEKSEEDILKELSHLENEFKTSFSHPLKKITKRDIVKGFIGAFVGVMSHFAFSKAADIAITLEPWRSTVLYVVAFFIITIMLYYTGFRNIEKHLIVKFMPIRATLLYLVSILTIIFVNALFGKLHFPVSFLEMYNLVGASIIIAVMGAGTADLIGRSE